MHLKTTAQEPAVFFCVGSEKSGTTLLSPHARSAPRDCVSLGELCLPPRVQRQHLQSCLRKVEAARLFRIGRPALVADLECPAARVLPTDAESIDEKKFPGRLLFPSHDDVGPGRFRASLRRHGRRRQMAGIHQAPRPTALGMPRGEDHLQRSRPERLVELGRNDSRAAAAGTNCLERCSRTTSESDPIWSAPTS